MIINRFFNLTGSGGPNYEFGYNVWPPTHLFPKAVAAAMGLLNDFEYTCPMDLHETRDGSTTRDYIHVEDIASGIVKDLGYLQRHANVSEIINLGSGQGQTTKEIADEISSLIGEFPRKAGKIRDGEAPSLVANISKAHKLLGWSPDPRHNLRNMVLGLRDWFNSETALSIREGSLMHRLEGLISRSQVQVRK